MKQHLINGLMMVIVFLCLMITLNRQPPAHTPALSAEKTFVQPAATPHPLDAYRQRRAQQQADAMETLETLALDKSSGPDTQAREALFSLQSASQTEQAVEGMLLTLGYEKCLCICQPNGLLLFTQPDARQQDIPLILQSAADLSGFSAENIRLMAP